MSKFLAVRFGLIFGAVVLISVLAVSTGVGVKSAAACGLPGPTGIYGPTGDLGPSGDLGPTGAAGASGASEREGPDCVLTASGPLGVDAIGSDPLKGTALPLTVGGWSRSKSMASPDVACGETCGGGGGYVTNLAAVVSYAQRYVGTNLGSDSNAGYNPAYVSFDNDCQDFVSQALKAGGWTNDLTGLTGITANANDYTQWFYHLDPYAGWQWSVTWDNSMWFMRYINDNPDTPVRGYYLTNWADAQPGDVIQVDWDGTANGLQPSHSMLITATGSTVGDIKITQHTTNRLNYPLKTDMANFPHAAWWLMQPY